MTFRCVVRECCERSADEREMAVELAILLLKTEPVKVVRDVLHRMGVSTADWDFSYYEGRHEARFLEEEG